MLVNNVKPLSGNGITFARGEPLAVAVSEPTALVTWMARPYVNLIKSSPNEEGWSHNSGDDHLAKCVFRPLVGDYMI